MEKNFNHSKAEVADQILLIGELEHIRRHALRSAVSARNNDDTDDSSVDVPYLTIANQAKTLRREYMAKHFAEISDEDWCLCKAAASLRQLAYEIAKTDTAELSDIEELVDDIWGMATGLDLTDCVACKEDRNAFSDIKTIIDTDE